MHFTEFLVFAGVFSAICVAYLIGFGRSGVLQRPGAYRNVRRCRPPIDINVKYRNASGRKTVQKVRL